MSWSAGRSTCAGGDGTANGRSEHEDQPAPDAAGLEQSVGLGGLLRAKGARHAQREGAVLGLGAQLIELLALVRVVADVDRVKGDAAVRLPSAVLAA